MSIPKAKSESRFEFTLRLTKALKYAENEGVIRQDHGGFYLDSKTMLDVLYAEVIASDKTAGEACYQFGDASAIKDEFNEFSPSVGRDDYVEEPTAFANSYIGYDVEADQSDDHIQRAPVAERAYVKSEPIHYTSRLEWLNDKNRRLEIPGHGTWSSCDCFTNNEGWNKHYELVKSQLAYEATQTQVFPPLVPFGIGETSAVQKTIDRTLQPCGAVGSVSAKGVTSSVEVK